jgi:hypothetical protein
MTDDIDIGETEKLYLPWHHNDNGLITGTLDDPESENYPHIADLATEPGMEGDGDKYRAEFIVLACNAHHDLLAALKEARGDFIPNDPSHPTVIMMDAAIAKAGGQQ